jgi:hypothetical protein
MTATARRTTYRHRLLVHRLRLLDFTAFCCWNVVQPGIRHLHQSTPLHLQTGRNN